MTNQPYAERSEPNTVPAGSPSSEDAQGAAAAKVVGLWYILAPVALLAILLVAWVWWQSGN